MKKCKRFYKTCKKLVFYKKIWWDNLSNVHTVMDKFKKINFYKITPSLNCTLVNRIV